MEQPFKMKDMSAKTLNQVKGIVGFKIHIREIQAAYKLSQNRNDHDYGGIISKLEKSENSGDIVLGKEMSKRRLSK